MNEIERTIEIVQERNFCNGCTTADTRGLENCRVCDRYIAKKIILQALQEKAEREENKSLTLVELEQMEGESVWCVDARGHVQCYLVDSGRCICSDYSYLFFENLNKIGDDGNLHCFGWRAYRYKPKGVAK